MLLSAHYVEWDIHLVGAFLERYYGNRATPALVEILSERSTRANYFLQTDALSVSGGDRLHVPVALLLEYARSTHASDLDPTEKSHMSLAAYFALSRRTDDPTLVSLWEDVMSSDSELVRQYAPRGFACSAGPPLATDRINTLLEDPSPIVRHAAEWVADRIAADGASARVCADESRADRVAGIRLVLSAELLQKADIYMHGYPR